jgi:hypothetical protein
VLLADGMSTNMLNTDIGLANSDVAVDKVDKIVIVSSLSFILTSLFM